MQFKSIRFAALAAAVAFSAPAMAQGTIKIGLIMP
jgi:hypothetical protein